MRMKRFLRKGERTAQTLLEVLDVARVGESTLEGIGSLNEVLMDVVVGLVADLRAAGNVLTERKIWEWC